MKINSGKYNSAIAGVLFLLILHFQLCNATTLIVDNIVSDTTWAADTVKVMNDISVASSYTLTIKPGTYIEFQGHYKLELNGRLIAIGTPDSMITFTVNDTTLLYDLDTIAGGWNGIDFYHLSGDTSKLEYCVLEYGKATDGDEAWNFEEDAGGAIFCRNWTDSPPVLIKNCIIQSSIATEGGGIMINQGDIILLNNVIRYNRASYSAGVVVGYSDALVNANIITNNISGYGGIFILENTNGLITNNLIVNNEIKIYSLDGAVAVNSASTTMNFSFYNNVVANNRAHGNCGGITVNNPNAEPPYKNNIVCNNQAEGQNYQFYPDTIKFVEYNCIQGGYSGTGNIDADPKFVNPSAGAGAQYDGLSADWALQNISPCIDAGKPDFIIDSIGVETDFVGSPRIQYGIIDIGAYEITYCTPAYEPDPENILYNGDFGTCDIYPEWYLHTDASLSEPADYIVLDEGCRVIPRVLGADPQSWHIQLGQVFSPEQEALIMMDSTYKLTFDAFADTENRPCTVTFGLANDPWTVYHDQSFMVGKNPESYSFEFTANQEYSSFLFAFHLGSDLSPITLDNVRLVKMPAEPQVNEIDRNNYDGISVFPNPAHTYINIFAEEGSVVRFYNTMGILIDTKVCDGTPVIITTGGLVEGVYYIGISNGNTTSIQRILIQ
jgi:hypothetical protein